MLKLTAQTRRGLMILLHLVEADLDAMDDDDLTIQKRGEVNLAVRWLRQQALPAKVKRAADSEKKS